jgi:hypothetical protein
MNMNETNATPQWKHSYLLKDSVDAGLNIVKNKSLGFQHRAHSLSDVLPAITASDNLFKEGTGEPDFDLHIWLALATMLIGAGDAIFSGVKAWLIGRTTTIDDTSVDEVIHWEFRLDFSGTESVWLESMDDSHKRMIGENRLPDTSLHHGRFLTITHLLDERQKEEGSGTIDQIVAKYTPSVPGFAWRPMGEILEKDLEIKMLTYPASVHPQLKDRTIANIPLYVAAKLGDAGLYVVEHWFPEDTSRSFARYILSDGIEHFVMDFHGGHLAVILSHLDTYIERDAADGGIQLDVIQPSIIALEHAGDMLDQLAIHQHP